MIKAAENAGVKRIIYLGGLVNESLELSKHMRSRHEVGKILASGNIPVTELRASVIVGAEGGSYAMLRYLVERLPLMVCPRWVKSTTQPIAVSLTAMLQEYTIYRITCTTIMLGKCTTIIRVVGIIIRIQMPWALIILIINIIIITTLV